MKQSITRELHTYWTRLKGARLAPERNDIQMPAIRHLLPYVFLVQADRKRGYPLKMCGTRLNAFWLDDLSGRPFLDLWTQEDRETIERAIDTVMESARPMVVGARSGVSHLSAVDLELLLLPLRDSGKTHSLVLGALAPSGQPNWLGLAPVQRLSLTSSRIVRAEPEDVASAEKKKAPHSEPAGARKFVVYEGGKSSRRSRVA